MDTRERKRAAAKNLLYLLVILFAFVIGEIPQFDPLYFKAIPVIPVVVALGMQEGDLSGGIFGFIAGILVDTFAYHIFGLASIIFTILGFACGVLVTYLLQNNMRTAMILTLSLSGIYGIVSYYVIYGMWQEEGKALMFFAHTVPTVIVTGICSFPAYYLVRKIKTEFEERR